MLEGGLVEWLALSQATELAGRADEEIRALDVRALLQNLGVNIQQVFHLHQHCLVVYPDLRAGWLLQLPKTFILVLAVLVVLAVLAHRPSFLWRFLL